MFTNQVIANSGIVFGTSGARGLVTEFTPNVSTAFTLAFLEVMLESFNFNKLALAIDNRPSSLAMAQACAQAAKSIGIEVIYYGVIPTPALAYKSMSDHMPAVMVTGSHIPFDRNGFKFYRPDGEITKIDELAITNAQVQFEEVITLEAIELEVDKTASDDYCMRYSSLFSKNVLKGKHIGVYEHSSAGRDIYSQLFRSLGAHVTSLERCDEFVPIDTEAVSDEDVQKARLWANEFSFDAIFSTDGDGDRPLIADEHGHWLHGDILGLLCAKSLGIEALAVPISCNTAIEVCDFFKQVNRTKIGSPYVIAEFEELNQRYDKIAGFEANGGFLLGSDISINGKLLTSLPTRDALLPALILLANSELSVSEQVGGLPRIFTYSDRIKAFSTKKSLNLIAKGVKNPKALLCLLQLDQFEVLNINNLDGLRLSLSNNSIIHLRPSGNSPELRCYVETDNLASAKLLVEMVLFRISSSKDFI